MIKDSEDLAWVNVGFPQHVGNMKLDLIDLGDVDVSRRYDGYNTLMKTRSYPGLAFLCRFICGDNNFLEYINKTLTLIVHDH